MAEITSSPIEPHVGCIASATAVLGQKWTSLILRDLAMNNCRFVDFERSIPDLNPRTLSKRLDDLRAMGVIDHDPISQEYCLTNKGRDLIPVLRAMAEWGEKWSPVTASN
jgi:DNA-binding HxlR family transcriptional regulator